MIPPIPGKTPRASFLIRRAAPVLVADDKKFPRRGEAGGSRFHLRRPDCRAIAAGVKRRAACILATLSLVSSCREKRDVVVVAETRPVTTRDTPPKLSATSDERFRDAKPSPVKGDAPEGWLALPASQFRLLNYRFGESGMGEVWVSIASGRVLDNVNRWRRQFGEPPIDQAALEKLREVPDRRNHRHLGRG